MDTSRSSESDKKVRSKPNLCERKKYYWKVKEKKLDTTHTSESCDTSAGDDLDLQDASNCEMSLDDVHLCGESDQFSSEFYSTSEKEHVEPETNIIKKKKLKKKIHSKDSFEKIGSQEDSDEESMSVTTVSLSDSDVDVECIDDDDKSSKLIPVTQSPQDIPPTSATLPFPKVRVESEVKIGVQASGTQIPTAILDESQSTSTEAKDDSAAIVPDETITCLMEDLKLLLPDKWIVDVLDSHSLRLIHVNSSNNAAVDDCIFYDSKSDTVKVFTRGIPIKKDSRLFRTLTVPEKGNMKSWSDFFAALVTKIQSLTICEGIKDNSKMWDISSGFLDYSISIESPRYRSESCEVHLSSKGRRLVCRSCQELLRKIKREIKRRGDEKTNPKTPDKHLSKEEIILKKDIYVKLAKKEKARADRLQKRVDALEIKLDEALKDDLSAILRANIHKMTPLQRTFWEAQMHALKLDDKRGAYEFLRESQVLCLPSRRRLYDYSHFVVAAEGPQQELTEIIRNKMQKAGSQEHFSYMNLMLDEMHIKAGLVVNSSGDLVGYTNINGVEEELRKLTHEIEKKIYKPQLAKKVLVYLVQGITNRNVKDVVAVYSTDDLTVTQLYDKTWEVIYHLEDAGVKVLTVTGDGAAVNRKLFFMHKSLDDTATFTYVTKNLAAGDSRPLFFIIDPPHLLKTLRNAFANSFSHKKTRQLWINGEIMSWKVIEKLYEITKGMKFPGHKLTKAHVKLTSFSCMTVRLATQIFSKSVGRSIQNVSSHPEMESLKTTEVVKFIFLMNRFFDCLNGMQEKEETTEEAEVEDPFDFQGTPGEEEGDAARDKAPYTDTEDPRFKFLLNDVLGYFNAWKKQVQERPGIHTQADLNAMIVTHQALGSLEITVKSIVGAIKHMITEAGAPAVCARVFNQDPLEQYFSGVRRSGGDNRQPTLKRVLDTRLNIAAQGQLFSASSTGNTQARKSINFDETPLPVRKKPKTG